MRVLELFSGIGGMHLALKESGVPYEIIKAADINTLANQVYKENFPGTELLQNNIQSFNEDFINKLEIEMIVMSPPCQPFSRVGKKQDLIDNRSNALSHIIDLLPKLNDKLKHILLENVRGFENSDARNSLVESLITSGYDFREFLLNPLQFGVANSRERFYLIAKRKPLTFQSYLQPNILLTEIPNLTQTKDSVEMTIEDILEFPDESPNYEEYLLPTKILEKRVWVLDIVTKHSKGSCCFTKAYSHYMEGTGSVYCPLDWKTVENIFEQLKNSNKEEPDHIKRLESLRLRFFTPGEVKRLLSFPSNFIFPSSVTKKQKYRLLGNSINVKVVSELIKLLVDNG